MAKTNWQGPVVGGLVGVGHFVLWLGQASNGNLVGHCTAWAKKPSFEPKYSGCFIDVRLPRDFAILF